MVNQAEVQMETLQVVKQDFESIKKKVASLEIHTEEDKGLVAESIGLLKRMMQKAEQARVQEVTPHNNTVSAINAKYNAFKIPAKQLLDDLNNKLIRRDHEEREAAREKRLEQERLVEEARRKQEAAEKKAEKKGLPPPLPAVVPFVEVPQVQKSATTNYGTLSVQENWMAEVTDIRALCKAVLSDKAPVNCIEANMVFLNKEAKRTKGESPYPGTRFFDKGKVGLR
jgi:hypothetical protein